MSREGKGGGVKRFIKTLILIIIIGAVAFGTGYWSGRNYKAPEIIEHTDPLVLQQSIEGKLADASDLVTVEYRYTNAASQESSLKIKGWTIPLTTKRFVVRYDGVIKAGIDISKVEISVVDMLIGVKIPKSAIISHEIDQSSLEVLDETKNIFNPIQVEDYNSFQAEQKKLCERNALSKGLLEEADENARHVIKELIESMDISQGYTIVFQ